MRIDGFRSGKISGRFACLQRCVALGCAILLAGCSGKKAAAPPPAVPVTVATVTQRDIPLQVHAIGNVQPYSTVQIKSEVSAQLEAVHFKEGDEVHKGQLLFTLDRRQLEADVRKAEGTLAKDQAELKNAQAKAARYAQLLKAGVVAQQDYDQVAAQAGSLEATVDADRATVQNQKVQLTYTSIYAPITGRTGALMVNAGNLVKENDVPLVTLNQVSPIYVTFALPEQDLDSVKKYAAEGTLKVAVYIGGDAKNPATGSVSFLDNTVDPTTGTIKLKAVFPNHDRRLWPGQFVDAVLTLANQANAVVVPSVAVQTGQQGQYVYVVKPDSTAENRGVTVARTFGNDSIIAKGLQPGERVVTDGQVRLQPGAKVDIKNPPANADNNPATPSPRPGE